MNSASMLSENYTVTRTSPNVFQMDLLVEDLRNNSSNMIQNFSIQQLDDTHFQFIPCENQETYTLHLTNQNPRVDGFGRDKVPAISHEGGSVIQHSSSSALQPENSNQEPFNTTKRRLLCDEDILISYYSCCTQQFDSLTVFREHLKLHIDEEKFSCSNCQARFMAENNLKIHMITTHPGNSNTCPICHVSFQRKASLKSHVLIHQEEELFPCKKCGEELQTYDELLKHMESHGVIKKSIDSLICQYCKMKFGTSSDYKEHVAKHKEVKKNILKERKVKKRATRNERKRFKCKYCIKVFPKYYSLDRHERIHTGEKPFKCNICSKGFAQSNSLKFHIDKHKGLRPYCCTLCPAKFTQKGNLRAHVEKTHTAPINGFKTYKCSQCACIFKKIASLNGHITKVHLNSEPEEATDPQSIITKVVNGLRELNNDAERAGSKEVQLGMSEVKLAESEASDGVRRYAIRHKKIDDVRWYFCNYCSSRFKKPSDLIRHLRTHTLERPFKCPKCEQNFSLKATLVTHLKTHDKPNAEINHCDTSFKSTRNFNSKVRNHEALSYICFLCQKGFATFEECKNHRSAHEGEIQGNHNIIEPQTSDGASELKASKSKVTNTQIESSIETSYHCKICDARFTRLTNLKRHAMRHSGERKFKCTICPKTFVTNYDLKEHFKHHNNINKYECTGCDKKFSTSSVLKRHMIVHNKTDVCSYCQKHFKTTALCREHIEKMHQVQEVALSEELSVIKHSENLANEAPSNGVEPVDKSDPIVLSIASEDQNSSSPAELQSNYQMVYLNISDMPDSNNSENILNQNTLIPNINIFNPLDSLQDSAAVFFSIHPEKPEMVDPNEVLKYNKLDKTDDLAGTHSVQFGDQSGQLLNDQGLYTVNLSEIPISIIDTSESANLINSDIISGNPPVICINCHKMFSSCSLFENHLCSAEATPAVQGSLEVIIQGGKSEKIFTDVSSMENTGQSIIHDSEDMKEVPEPINIFESQSLNISTPPEVILDLPNTKRAKSRKSSQTNINSADQVKHLSCKLCNFTTQSEDHYRKHLLLHPDLNETICKFCCKDFHKPSDLKRHIRTHTGEKPYECDQCHKKFSLKSTLESHIRTHNLPGVPKLTCHVCNSNLSSKSSLRFHMLGHTGAKPYPCKFCGEMFKTPAIRKLHEKKQHLTINQEEPLPSSDASKLAGLKLIKFMAEQMEVSAEKDLKKDEHTEAKDQEPVVIVDPQQLNWVPMDSTELFQQLQPYGIIMNSEADPNISGTMDDLEVLNVNNDLQMSATEETNLQQSSDKDQKRHKNKEQKQKVECDICHKLYSTKDVLRKHKKGLHGQNKKFPCIKCDKGYDHLEELNKHIAKLHSGYRPYTCQYCSNSFGEEGSLKGHIKRIHQKSLIADETTNALLGLQYDLSSDLFV